MLPDGTVDTNVSEWRDDAEADKLRDEAFRRLLDVPPKVRRVEKAARPALREEEPASLREQPDAAGEP